MWLELPTEQGGLGLGLSGQGVSLEEGTRASKTILQVITYYMMMVRFGLAIDHIGGCVKNGLRETRQGFLQYAVIGGQA